MARAGRATPVMRAAADNERLDHNRCLNAPVFRSVNAHRLQIVLAGRGKGEIAVVRDVDDRPVRGMDQVGVPSVNDHLGDIGEVLQAQDGERPFE